jgi:hypothetical protein
VIIKTLGEGSEHLSFSYSGINYHYRFYSTTMTEHQYALLFSNGSLLAVSEKKPNVAVCTYQTAWDVCFSSAIRQL